MRKEPFYIMICDDEQADREKTAKMTEQICRMEQIHTDISCFTGGEQILDSLRQGKPCDLLLADVMMPEVDGMELARFLRREKSRLSIVFISSNREMALRGYEVAADRYLTKPVSLEALQEAIRFCYDKMQPDEDLVFPVHKGMKKIAPSEIVYVEIKGRKSRIVLENEEWDTSFSINEVEKMLSGYRFVRCHQSFLVNYCYVRTLCALQIELKDGKTIPVSKHRIKEVKKRFFEYMEG